ncbi:PorP/SprF family type IX secretion system membrane protein [Sungkyunkwania multivorans]|uniref:PorP/SprF family type IX secretion system membrane protein n=1 Tax=Sungkyunkwania multivorans TaxID=1173618 RepID=A0ABW3CYX6_9FLAO
MVRKICLYTTLIFGAFLRLIAQQNPVFAEYNYNPFIINSAYAGLQSEAEANLSSIGLLGSFDGAPQTSSFTLNAPLYNEKMALGGGIIHDKIGVTTVANVFAAYSYKIFFEENRRPNWQIYDRNVISFGITAGVISYQEDLLSLNIEGDQNFAENINIMIPSLGVGFLFNHGPFAVGLSVPNILGDALASDKVLNITTPVYGYMGYKFYLNRFKEMIFKPNFLTKFENGIFQADLNMGISYLNKIDLGCGYRTNASFNFFGGFYFWENFRFVYHYNSATRNAPINNTHGIILSYRFGNGFNLN